MVGEEEPPAQAEIALPAEAPEIASRPPEPERREQDGVVQPGDTMTALLGSWFSPAELLQLRGQSLKVFPLRSLCAGQPYRLCTLDDRFDSFIYDINSEEQFIIRRNGDQLELERVPIPYTVTTEQVQGVINSSLFEAVTASGERPELAIRLADIFAWDIDFIRDLRVGDSFQALVEKRFRDGQHAGYGRILAAEFTNQGQSSRAILFKDGERDSDYFDFDGRSLRKAFLKAPLQFSRISSGFSRSRKHPVTGDYKPHLAIDYAAPIGTPVKTIGDGTVLLRGYDPLSGNKVRIRHPNGYETMYIHLSKFAAGLRVGKKVRQAEVIAYVGTTGRSTGPHLDFRVFKNGAAINPLSVKSTPARPVSDAYRPAFRAVAQEMSARFSRPSRPGTGELRQVGHAAPGGDRS